jgi:hypothetical protein
MSPSLKSLFLLLMALGVVLVVVQSIRNGVVTWRHGPPAAVRSENPVAFWSLIALYVFLAAGITAAALLQ